MVHQSTTYSPKRTNHVLHLLLTAGTCGAWGFVWAGVAVWNAVTREKHTTVTQQPGAWYGPVARPYEVGPGAPVSAMNPHPPTPGVPGPVYAPQSHELPEHGRYPIIGSRPGPDWDEERKDWRRPPVAFRPDGTATWGRAPYVGYGASRDRDYVDSAHPPVRHDYHPHLDVPDTQEPWAMLSCTSGDCTFKTPFGPAMMQHARDVHPPTPPAQ